MSYKKVKKSFSVILSLVVALIVAWQFLSDKFPTQNTSSDTILPAESNGVLIASFLDVDQGDCEFFKLPDGKTLLIDAGNIGDGDEIVSFLKQNKIAKLDFVIATHPHADHIGGMSDVIDSFEIGQVFAPKIADADVPTTKTYENFLLSVQRKGLKITAAKQGTTLFSGEDYKAECFAPCSDNYESLNNYSVTVKLSYGIHSFLLTGDTERISEGEMLKNGYNLKSDVLKVAHHGSSTSTSKAFLNAVSPDFAVISCGEGNSYGHPHAETLKTLKGITLLRTDLDKTIVFSADGKTKIGLTYTTNNPSVVK